MAHATPLVRDAALWVHDGLGQGKTISLESAAWWHWLEDGEQRTFRFEHSSGTFTARREQKRSGYYWYAYRKYQGRLYKTYLGKAEELRLDCLERAAYTLSELAGHIPARTNVDGKAAARQGAIEASAPVEPQKLLATKLYQPPARAGIVTRPYLLRRLDMSLESRLMLVVAPAGFGKTTLLSDWCTSRADMLHAWLSLDKGDNDPARFWGYVLASLQRICPSLCAGSFAEPRLGSLDGMLTELVNALADLDQDIVLILDDYHLITISSVHEDIAFLLEHVPPRLHLALASRVEPPLPLARLRARGQLAEIHATDLRFTTDEAARFLRQVMKLNVSQADVELLEARTEGWIAAIQLVALSAQAERTSSLTALTSPAGQHRYIIDYLTEEVLLSQPEDARSFLLQTSLLERFNAEVCDAVTGRSESADVLKRFEHANLFLVALDAEGEWWRYHHLFAEFLRHSLRRMHPDWIAPLYERASAWFESQHLMNEAIHYAFVSGNLMLTARLIQACALGTMARGEITTLLGWLENFPEAEMRRYPFLHAAFAGALTGVGQLERAGAQLQLAQAAIEDLKASGERREEWRELDGLYLVCAGSLASFRGDVSRALNYSQQALAILAANPYIRCVLAASMGNAYLLNGDYAKAYEEFDDAVRLGLPGLNPHAALASMAGQGSIQFMRGRLYEAHDTFERVVNTCVRHTDSLMSTLSLAYVFQGEVLYEWNDLEGAERVVNEGLELGKAWGYVGVLAYSYIRLSSIKQARGESREALALLEQGIRVVEGFDMEQYKALMAARYARACLDAGRLDDARRWAETLEIRDDLSSHYPRDVEYLTWVRVRIAEGRLDDAASLLARLLPCFEAAEAVLSLVEGLCMQARLTQLQHDDKGAEQMLGRALTLGEAGGLIRSFVDQGSDMSGLLRQVANEGRMSVYVNRLLAVCCVGELDESALLSERELDVLRLIAAGRSNQHIAGDLVVALSTVKTHLNNIYVKLGVHSRTQAVARAQELMLL